MQCISMITNKCPQKEEAVFQILFQMNRMKAQDMPATVRLNQSPGTFSRRPSELFVPQTVDQGVDDWGEDSVNSRDELVELRGINGLGRTCI